MGFLKSIQHIIFKRQQKRGSAQVFQISILLKALFRWLQWLNHSTGYNERNPYEKTYTTYTHSLPLLFGFAIILFWQQNRNGQDAKANGQSLYPVAKPA